MAKSTFIYVTYIRTNPEKLWKALVSPEFIRQYWFGIGVETDWKVGSPWQLIFPDGRIADSGEILECDPPKRLVIKWRNEFRPELKAEGYTRCVFAIEAVQDAVKLTVNHSAEIADAKVIGAVAGGWPRILSNLKSLMETGEVVFTH